MPMYPSRSCTAALLAGGRSQRMGRDKASLLIDGAPLWRRQLATLEATGPDALLISGRADGPYADSGVEIVTDLRPGFGPLSGLHAILQRAETELVVALAIDLPDIKAEFLRALMTECGDSALVPKGERWFEPLAAVYSRACWPLIDECLAGPDHSMQNFVRRAVTLGLAKPRPLTAEELRCFRNVNTPGDL